MRHRLRKQHAGRSWGRRGRGWTSYLLRNPILLRQRDGELTDQKDFAFGVVAPAPFLRLPMRLLLGRRFASLQALPVSSLLASIRRRVWGPRLGKETAGLRLSGSRDVRNGCFSHMYGKYQRKVACAVSGLSKRYQSEKDDPRSRRAWLYIV